MIELLLGIYMEVLVFIADLYNSQQCTDFKNFYSSLGIIGPSAYGKEVTRFYSSDIYGYPKANWLEIHQIQNAFGLNVKWDVCKTFSFELHQLYMMIYSVSNVINCRNGIFTDISTGFYGRIGFKPLQKTIKLYCISIQI